MAIQIAVAGARYKSHHEGPLHSESSMASGTVVTYVADVKKIDNCKGALTVLASLNEESMLTTGMHR